MDFELGVDTIFFDALIDPLLQVSEDFLEFIPASSGPNINVWLDYDGQGEAYVPQLIAVLINPS